MTNPYDVAKIISGDPMSQVEAGADEADALLAQYEHQKDIIDDINRALESAESKSKKGKGLFGLGGTLLGGLIGLGGSLLVPGSAPAWIGNLISALASGAGAGIAEKERQKKYDATEDLERLEKKYKGRKQVEGEGGVTDIREEVEEGLDKMVTQDVLLNALLGGIMPGTKKGLFGKPSVAGNLKGPFGIPMGIGGRGIKETVSPGDAKGDILSGIASMFGKNIPSEMIQSGASNDIVSQLIKSFGPGVLGAFQEKSPFQIGQFGSPPPFRNPYRRR